MKKLHTVKSAHYLTPALVAKRWGWHEESVRRWVRKRKIECVVVGRRILIAPESVEAVEGAGRIPALVFPGNGHQPGAGEHS